MFLATQNTVSITPLDNEVIAHNLTKNHTN